MKNLKYIFPAFMVVTLAACSGDPLDLKKTNTWEDEYVWRIPKSAEGVLIKAYQANPNLPDQGWGDNFLDVATDNGMTWDHSSAAWLAGNGGFSRTNTVIGNWEQCYNQFQYIHQFMENGLGEATLYDRLSVENDAAIKERLRGEAYFLRAWWGFKLLQRFGGRSAEGKALGYPIVTEFIDKDNHTGAELFVRNTYEECVTQILSDCDEAIERLPAVYNNSIPSVNGTANIGRATSVAAWALKSNVTLYAASPAYQDQSVVSLDGMGEFTVGDAAIVQEKWERAALTADSVLRLGGFGNFYALVRNDLAEVNTGTTPGEFLFRRFTSNNNLENRHNPPFNYGEARSVPSQNLVDAYPSRTGFPITDSRSGYDETDPYALVRDKRFTLGVYHNGQMYNNDLGNVDVVWGGNGSPMYDTRATATGYYLAKFMANRTVTYDTKGSPARYHPYLRKAEVFLNYAEAANEAWGPTGKGTGCLYSAYDVIKTIRSASGGITDTEYLDEMAVDKDEFRKLIHNERRIELAFENHRFFDMRRLLLPLNEPVRGMKITRDGDGFLHYEEVIVEQRPMNETKYYFIPLPDSELMKNPSLVNNMGW
jgi:hypothetical protein